MNHRIGAQRDRLRASTATRPSPTLHGTFLKYQEGTNHDRSTDTYRCGHSQHSFDALPSHGSSGAPQCRCYVQTSTTLSPTGNARDWYEVIFYNFHRGAPGQSGQESWWDKGARAALERLEQAEQGIVILRHA